MSSLVLLPWQPTSKGIVFSGERTVAEDLRRLFERFGVVKDVYIPMDFYAKYAEPFMLLTIGFLRI
jgi:hypothetical protein